MRAKPLFLCALAACAQFPEDFVARLAEEAEVFRRAAPSAVARETLTQTTAAGAGRLRSRELISEYTIGALREAPEALHEFRQVVSVDGREVRQAAKARQSLVRGLASADDRVRKRMIDDLRRYGLEEAAVDVAPLILLFTKRRLPEYQFERAGETLAGADPAAVLRYRQTGGSQGILVFQQRRAIHQSLQGEIVCRRSDGLPLRITMRAGRRDGPHIYLEEAAVDYVMTPHGFLAPAAAVHRGYIDGLMRVEHLFRYSRFQKFGASTEIKFTEVPEVK